MPTDKTIGQVDKWTKETAMSQEYSQKTGPRYPNEAMVKIFSSKHYSNLHSPILPGQKVIDVGCGFGNNLVFFADRGCEVHGAEVNKDMVEVATENLTGLGIKSTIVLGNNESLPYKDNEFDYLISCAAIHYQEKKAGILKALAEFKRVVKPGGKIFITTVGPDHQIRTNSRRIDEFQWEVVDFGFRNGCILSFFDNKDHLSTTLQEHFTKVETGVLSEQYSTWTLDFYYALCINE